MTPRVGVIITTHDRPRMVERAIRSVLDQTFTDLDILVVDDASSPPTAEALVPFQDRGDIRMVRIDQSKGANNARATGALATESEYLAYLDDDDSWEPTKLERQVEIMESTGDISLVGCGWQSEQTIILPPENIPYEALLSENLIGSFSVGLFRKSDLETAGGFDLTLTNAQDWDLWLRLAKVGRVISVPAPLVQFNTAHGQRISTSTDTDLYYRSYERVTDAHAHEMDRWTKLRHKYTVAYHTTPADQPLQSLQMGMALFAARKVDRYRMRRLVSVAQHLRSKQI